MQWINRVTLASVCLVLGAVPVCAQDNSLWERRDPKTSYLFWDYRARLVGDVLTIVINETTEADANEMRNMNKQTLTNAQLNLNGTTSVGSGPTNRQFAAAFNGQAQSQRQLQGQNQTMIDRTFSDRMTVVVLAVYPNGNLLVQGYRQRVVAHETRTLRLTGIVRPADIGPYNQILSQYVADVRVDYIPRGADSAYLFNGWLGKVMNVVWPF